MAVAFLAIWYFYFLRYNRKRAKNILQWISGVSAGHANVRSVRWDSRSHFQVKLQLESDLPFVARPDLRGVIRPIPTKTCLEPTLASL